MPDLVQIWSGCHADSLRQALRMTNESFAEHLGVSVRTVAYWRRREDMIPTPAMQEILDTALDKAPQRAKDHFWRLQAGCAKAPADSGAVLLRTAADAGSLTEWLTATSVSDEVIGGLDRTVARLAEDHALAAPTHVLGEAQQVQDHIQELLRGGRVRHRQERELLRINGNVLAHISLLLSDLGDDTAGEEYGNAARLFLHEAGATEAPAWYVLAKIARWRHHYAQAADLARAGQERSAPNAMRVQLACYEANAAALARDPARAITAMRLAEDIAGNLPPGQITLSPWSFPEERMAIFRISVALGTGDNDQALAAASAWDASAVAGRPHVTAAWAQIRVGAAIARLGQGALDGAAEEVAPMLALPPEFRIATITGWLDDLGRRLAAGHYAGSPIASSLQEEIRQFTGATARPLERNDR